MDLQTKIINKVLTPSVKGNKNVSITKNKPRSCNAYYVKFLRPKTTQIDPPLLKFFYKIIRQLNYQFETENVTIID